MCLIIPAIMDLIPLGTFPRNLIDISMNIRLADFDFSFTVFFSLSIELLIGFGATLSLFFVRQINLSREGYDLYLQQSGVSLNNIIMGPLRTSYFRI